MEIAECNLRAEKKVCVRFFLRYHNFRRIARLFYHAKKNLRNKIVVL